MHLRVLYRRSLAHHWRTSCAVVLGVIAGTAALTGALLVGDSMRGSLRAAALERLGDVDHALTAPRFFHAALAKRIAADPELGAGPVEVCPAILARGGATQAESHATAQGINVIGADKRFWRLGEMPVPASDGRTVVINRTLADDLHAAPGDDLLLRIGRPADVSTDMLLGRRDETTLTLRLTVARVIPAEQLGAFSLWPQARPPRNAYVPLATAQRLLRRPGQANALLMAAPRVADGVLPGTLKRHLELDDLGLRLRADERRGYVALESTGFLIPPAVEDAARAAAGDDGRVLGMLAQLANEIAVAGRPGTVIPYSTVAAVAPEPELLGRLTLTDGTSPADLGTGEVLLNEWAADDLAAQPGDTIRLTYYVMGPAGALDTAEATFRLRGVVRLDEPAADPGFVPEYPGVTDTDSLADWDPPFPIDLGKIRPKDEDYWRQYRTTPKAFVTLADGQRLWAAQPERLGRLTSLRVYRPADSTVVEVRAAFANRLRREIDPAMLGLRFEDVRQRALAASQGTTDFGGLFIGFSIFLIVAAAMLVALLFRLGVERRSEEVGLLLALGFTPRRVCGLLVAEGALLAVVGAAVGLLAARGYAWLMLAGLRTWWSAAVNAPFLQLHGSALSYGLGYGISVLVATASVAWSLRGLTRLSPQALLAGVVQAGRPRVRRRGRTAAVVAVAAVALAVLLSVMTFTTDAVSQSAAFFGGGVALLVACLAGLVHWLRGESGATVRTGGAAGLWRLGVRNARRHVGRSALTAGLIACAVFNITALQAMRLEPPALSQAKNAPTGGFALLGETAVPLPYDPGEFGVGFVPFRLRAGDDASCLNVYRPTQPRLLGATGAMIERGGFLFSRTLAESDAERNNPWLLLRRTFADGAVPAIMDEATALWQLHLALGKDLVIADERGRDVHLRIVALLKGSFLQGESIIAEMRFIRLFPSVSGYGFFLIDAPPGSAARVAQTLERKLTAFGFAVETTRQRLAELMAVQNTYLSTFQMLGGLGLLLGTVGLAAVLLRNVWERRGELALLQALGFSRVALGWLVLSENAVLVAAGLAIGLVSAGVVIAPHAAARSHMIPWSSLLLTFAVVFATGMLAGLVALTGALRGRLLPALRAE